MQLLDCCAGGENPFEIRLCMFWRLGIPNVAQNLVAHTRREAIHYLVCRLLPSRKVSLCHVSQYSIVVSPSTLCRLTQWVERSITESFYQDDCGRKDGVCQLCNLFTWDRKHIDLITVNQNRNLTN